MASLRSTALRRVFRCAATGRSNRTPPSRPFRSRERPLHLDMPAGSPLCAKRTTVTRKSGRAALPSGVDVDYSPPKASMSAASLARPVARLFAIKSSRPMKKTGTSA